MSIREVAKKANVSVSTVSRVINGTKPVSQELRERVLNVVKESDYRANSLARGLVSKKTKLIGVIIPKISNSYFSTLLEGIEEVSGNYGYNILLASSNHDLQKEIEYLQIFKERQLDGIIFSATVFTDLHMKFYKKNRIPNVFVGQKIEETHYPFVTINNYQATYELTKYLINQNHKKIAVMTGNENDKATGQERFLGFKKAMEESGLNVNPNWCLSGDHTIENGYYSTAKMMLTEEKPTAIVACSDFKALGAINYLREIGYRVPEDISVIGFDDSELATISNPNLTTIHQSPFDIGATATRLLMEQIQEKTINQKEFLIPYRLVIRESTRAI